MRFLIVGLCVATSASAATPKKSSSHSLKQVVSYVLAHGKQDTTIDVVEKDLGFPDSKPAKELGIDSKGVSKLISVRYTTGKDSKLVPDSIFWAETIDTTVEGKRHTDMWCFRSDLNGTLLGFVRGGGIEDDLDEKPAPIDDAARKKFEQLKKALITSPLSTLSDK